MGIENLIANSIQPSGIMTPFQLQAGQDELNQNKLMNDARRRAMAEQDRQRAQEGLINRLYSENYNNPEGFKRAAAQAGIGSVIPEYENQQREVQKEQRLQEAAGLEKIIKTSEVIASRLRGARPENWEQTVAGIEQEIGKPIPKLHFAYDPQKVDAVIQEGLSNTDAIRVKLDEYKRNFDEKKFSYDQQKDAQQMALREKTANNQQQWNQANFDQRDRQIEATRINAVNKPLTDAQGKANLFGVRASEAHKNLLSTEDNINKIGLAAKQGAENMPLIGGALGTAGNYMLDKDQQMTDQSQRDFLNAVLRQESGAVISPQEFDNAKKQYFPQPGDSKEVIEQKRKNRETEIQGLSTMSGPAQNRSQQPPSQQRTIVRTGRTKDGQKVVKYSDGSIEIAQ